ncbi:WXG100 family type VII secretion target [Nocardia sp. NRRL S-836]|uniref:WXG100 family type VII secretion target n=2 Tax=Actinomycetes TaxID=1760 RepID=UPI0006B06CC1|nr:hypothetical protein [Nocardia sp. NRRL S-836]KOV80618.1 hypothetical protein ADL03_32140 [Nocardia sp. NRRL S-836]
MADQNEIKKLLDDPNVTPETKKQLVPALAGAGASEEEVERYAKANGVDVPSDPGVGSHILGAVLAVPTAGLSTAVVAGKEINRAQWEKKGGDADKLVSKAKEERELGATQKVLNEQGDVPNSNTLLDAGAPGLRFFEKFIPVYQKAAPACGHQGAAPNLEGDIYRNYDWVRDIDFAKFREDANKLTETTKKLQEHDNTLGSAWNGLGSWEGKAAEAARGYHDKFAGTAKTFIQQTGQAPGAITAGVTNMQKHVKDFAQQIHDQYSEKCGGLTIEEAETAIRHANGDLFENDGGVLDWLVGVPGPLFGAVTGAICGGPLGMLAGLGWGSWISNTREGIINAAKDKLKALCQEFDSKKKAFDGYCQTVQTGVQSDYDTMFTALGTAIPPESPFAKVGDPPAFTEQGGDRKPVPPGGGTPPGGGGTPPGGGGTPPGGGGAPEMPKPENPLDKDGDGKPDVPGDTDGDGKPDDLDGDGKPDQPKPEEKLESVTVKAGDNTIKVTEPDSNGHVKMTIDTPKGEPKTYDLDFSKNPEAAKALMGQNGAQAVTALANQVAGAQTGAQTGAQATGTPVAGNTPVAGGGAAPTTGPLGSESNPIPVEVGADGKIHIEQDGVNFTAEVDPKTGEINLTADNGDGTPDRIGVEFGEDENPAASGPGGAGGATDLLDEPLRIPEQDFPKPVEGEFQTMPAPAEAGTAPAQADFQPMPAPAGEQVWSPPGQENVAERFQETMGRNYVEDNGIMPSLGEPKLPADGPQFAAQASDSTSTSGVSFTGGASGGSESVLGGSSPESAWNTPSNGDNGTGFNTNTSEAGQPGSANLPSMQDGAQGQGASGAASGGMMGGGMMGGGGMAGGGAGGQQGGDTERGASQWRTTGTLFDDDRENNNPLSAMHTVLGDDRGGR